MITRVSSSEQSPLITHNGRESQWSQASSGIWVPRTQSPPQHQSSPPHQDETQPAIEKVYPDRPAFADHGRWQRYWAEYGWTWRQEPEISLTRKEELTRRLAIPVDMKQGVYPFGGMTLTRFDIEWLLETHDAGQGPIDWSDASQQARKGLDLRGAAVSEGTDLRALPLARLQGGLLLGEWYGLTEEQRAHVRLCLKRANLMWAYLEEANLMGAHLEGADLRAAHLEKVSLREAHLEGARLEAAHLEGADLWGAHLEGADLSRAHLEGTNLGAAHLEGARLWKAHLEGVYLGAARLERAYLMGAHLEGADLYEAHLEGAYLMGASLASVDLTKTTLANAISVGPSLVDVKWEGTHLSVVDWSRVQMLGDEYHVCQSVDTNGQRKTRAERREAYQNAHRANHQLAVALQDQGLIEDATRFAYRAKCLQRMVFWYDLLLAQTMKQRFQMSWSLLFSWALFLLAGYGYRLRRCLFWYIGIVLAFTLLYWWLDPTQLPWWVALGESVNVFHGRGAAPTIAGLAHPVRFTLLTVAEAIIGLVIEIVFVATVIQRLFGK